MRTVARSRYQELLGKRLDVSVYEASEGRHLSRGPCKCRARYLCCAPWDLNPIPGGGPACAEHRLHARAALPPNRCHFNGAAVGMHRHHRDDTAIQEEDMIERTVSLRQDLLAAARDVFKIRHKPPQIAGRQCEQEPIAGPFG